jgi:hypothetical protein
LSGVTLSESELQRAVIECAKRHGWRVAHFNRARASSGNWITPVQGDAAGFPDLVLLRGTKLIVAELKAKYRKPNEQQWEWLKAFEQVGADGVYVWDPSDWGSGHIEKILR